MKPKTRERICLAIIVVAMAMAVWTISKVLMADGGWLYDHTKLICTVAGATIGLVLMAIAVMWNYDKPAVKVIAASALIVAAATANAGDKDKASGITTGQTNPYGNSSVAQPTWPYGWMLRGWNFLTWGNIWDSFEGWSTGAPKITVEPNPPASDDTSSK